MKQKKSRKQCVRCLFIDDCDTIVENKKELNERQFLIFTIENYDNCDDYKRKEK